MSVTGMGNNMGKETGNVSQKREREVKLAEEGY